MSSLASPAVATSLAQQFCNVRRQSELLCAPLTAEDMMVQSCAEASPAKWHLAHTTWFFETFLLMPSLPGYRPFHPEFGYLFNSYYEGVGARHPRPDRGLVSRPGVETITEYRCAVDEAMAALLESHSFPSVAGLVELGIHHEQQHQELLLMDIKHVLSCNPLLPAYDAVRLAPPTDSPSLTWTTLPLRLIRKVSGRPMIPGG